MTSRHAYGLWMLGYLAPVTMLNSCLDDAAEVFPGGEAPRVSQEPVTWFDRLPEAVRDAVLWEGDHEEASLYDWDFRDREHPGGGVFNTGGSEVWARATTAQAHSGRHAVEATITQAVRSANGDRAVRLMRWTDKAWDAGGEFFPSQGYFSVWMFLPRRYNPNKYDPWDPGDGGWWNVMQFKSDDEWGESQPLWVVNLDHDDRTQEMYFYLYTKYNDPASYGQAQRLPIPPGQWVHVEAYYAQDREGQGSIRLWQDGVLIISADDVVTTLETPIHWGIGNYTDHVVGGDEEGTATIFFDDAAVSAVPLHPYR